MSTLVIGAPARLVVRAAVHPKHKATKGHTKNRPKKVRVVVVATRSSARQNP
jgi:hypothetical protein|tara:strand:+ start:2319 stop:2474 length:156 start_codon:yes stop_codon:yes gene_type:complete